MKWKAFVDIDLPAKTDAFIQSNKLQLVSGVITAGVVTAQKLRVKYDLRKVSAEEIINKTGGIKSIEQ